MEPMMSDLEPQPPEDFQQVTGDQLADRYVGVDGLETRRTDRIYRVTQSLIILFGVILVGMGILIAIDKLEPSEAKDMLAITVPAMVTLITASEFFSAQ